MCKGCWLPEIYAEKLISNSCPDEDLPIVSFEEAIAEFETMNSETSRTKFSVFRQALSNPPKEDSFLHEGNATLEIAII